MKKLIALNLDRYSKKVYPHEAAFPLNTLDQKGKTAASINYVDLSHKLEHNALFFEGILNANGTKSYFHWFSFDPKQVAPFMDINPLTEYFAKIWDKKIPKGCLYKNEGEKSFKNHFIRSQYGKNEAELVKEAKSTKNLILMSDVTNYPYNEGWFMVSNGKMLNYGEGQIPEGKYWVIAKQKGQNSLKPLILTIKEGNKVEEDLSSLEFAFYVNPIIVAGKPLTSLSAPIPETKEILAHNWRGGIAHIFEETITPLQQYLDQKLSNSQYSLEFELKSLLQENDQANLMAKISKEKLADTVFSYLPAFKNNQAQIQDLKPGQYFYDSATTEFSTKLKRALYGHTMFGITKKGKIIVLKIFNKATKDNGLYIEQLGTAFKKICKVLFKNQNITDEIIFVGVGANGGDPRTFLGIGLNPGFKNRPEDNPQTLLQEKLAKVSCKPILIGFRKIDCDKLS